jgi:hypothetical protein
MDRFTFQKASKQCEREPPLTAMWLQSWRLADMETLHNKTMSNDKAFVNYSIRFTPHRALGGYSLETT